MAPELFHLIDEWNRPGGPLMIGSIVVAIPILFLFFYWVYRKRVYPVVAWLILSLAFFAISQAFPANRNQWFGLAIVTPLMCAFLTWFVFRALRRYRKPGSS